MPLSDDSSDQWTLADALAGGLEVDVLPDHVPADASEQARRLTVHHLLSMTTGHRPDSLAEAWELEPDDLEGRPFLSGERQFPRSAT